MIVKYNFWNLGGKVKNALNHKGKIDIRPFF